MLIVISIVIFKVSNRDCLFINFLGSQIQVLIFQYFRIASITVINEIVNERRLKIPSTRANKINVDRNFHCYFWSLKYRYCLFINFLGSQIQVLIFQYFRIASITVINEIVNERRLKIPSTRANNKTVNDYR